MTEYDALLLEHVLWATPEVAPKIADWLLAQLAVDDGMKQVGWCAANTVCKGESAPGVPAGRNDLLGHETSRCMIKQTPRCTPG